MSVFVCVFVRVFYPILSMQARFGIFTRHLTTHFQALNFVRFEPVYRNFTNDIALVPVVEPFDFSNSDGYVAPVCLPRRGQEINSRLTVSGWGHTHKGK